MALGHRGSLYVLAFDHRGSFRRDLFGIGDEPDAEQTAAIADAKQVVFEGLVAAADAGVAPRSELGVLVDEQFGAGVARSAREQGFVLSMPVERSDRSVFEFEYGDEFGAHIERFDPDFAKVLVRYNPDGDAESNRVQLERLKRLADWLHASDRRFLFELLVPPTPAQLDACDGEQPRFETGLRPELMRRAIGEVQAFGIEADIWKLEGIDDVADAERVATAARHGDGREAVRCLLLGAGAGRERVEHWLEVAAAADGYAGFAIGRSIWKQPLVEWLGGGLPREQAAREIGDRFARFVGSYRAARAHDR
jgi:myo-inositol catabolism protein IolC